MIKKSKQLTTGNNQTIMGDSEKAKVTKIYKTNKKLTGNNKYFPSSNYFKCKWVTLLYRKT